MRQPACGLQFLVQRDLLGIHGAVANRCQARRDVSLQLLFERLQLFGFGEMFRAGPGP